MRVAAVASRILLVAAVGLGALAVTSALWRPLLEPDQLRLTDALSYTLETAGLDAAVRQYRGLRNQGFPGLYESEAETNRLGYRLLAEGEREGAVAVFRLNVETHPGSANVYDSLGEALLAAGDEASAITLYRRAVAIDPKAKSALAALRRLTGFERPPYPPLVLFHIGAGALGLLSGATAASLRKGSRRHGVAGTVFVVSMLSMSASGATVALLDPDGAVLNVLMGLLTFYLVATAWWTAHRRQGRILLFDWGALLVVWAVAAGLAGYGWAAATSPAGTKDGIGPGFYLFFAAVALLAGALDLRRIEAGGVIGAPRIARHLWRMCAALFIAVTSLFLGQPQVFPDALRASGLLVVPSVLVVVLLIFWLIRVLFTKAFQRPVSPRPKVVVERATA